MKRRTYTVQPHSDKLCRCARCGRFLRSGQRVTIRRTPHLVTYAHAGRTCPPTFNPRPL